MAYTRMYFHGSALRASHVGPFVTDPNAYRPDQIVPVVPAGIGGVVRPRTGGRVWAYMPVATLDVEESELMALHNVRVRGWIGREAEFHGLQVLRDGTDSPVRDLKRPTGRLSGEAVNETVSVSGSWSARNALTVAMAVDFSDRVTSPEHFFTVHAVMVDYTEGPRL